MAIKTIPRRTLLQGAGGVAMALPALEIMMPERAVAADGSIPCRYVVSFAGLSVGCYKNGGEGDLLVPAATGPDYETTHVLQPLDDLGIKQDVTVVSNLRMPAVASGPAPAGGWSVGNDGTFHGTSPFPQLTGARWGNGPNTTDRFVEDAIAGDTVHRSLHYYAQAEEYISGGGANHLSRRDGAWVGHTISPEVAYASLFSNFTPPDADPEEFAAAQRALVRRRRVVDHIMHSAERLRASLGQVDRQRMERHLDELRALESRLDDLEPPTASGCELLPHPGPDPEIGATYSGEEERLNILKDLVHMAFVCDLSRVATLQMTAWVSYMSCYELPEVGVGPDMHELSHGDGSYTDQQNAVKWHVRHFAELVAKLKDTPEVDGSSLLEHTVLTLLFEGGWGFDPETGGVGTHSTENMSVLIAGHPGGLNAGQHVRTDGLHPTNVLISAMRAVGVEQDMPEVSGHIPELFA